MAIASEEKLKQALAPFELRKTEIDNELLAIEVERIELEAKLAKSRAELEEMKLKGYNPLGAVFQAGLTTTPAIKNLLNRRAKSQNIGEN